MSKNLKVTAGIGGLVLAAIVAWLAFGVFGIHTAFVDDTVSEDNPFAVTTAAAPDEAESSTSDADNDSPPDSSVSAAADTSAEADEPGALAAVDAEDSAEPEPATEPAAPEVPEITTLASGSIVDHDHSGEGTVTVLTDGTDRFLRFEDDFAIDNGPDLNVYLVRGATADGDPGLFDDDFIDLGDLKGNVGAQNYQLSPDIDLAEYNTVAIWCVRFGVAFNAADLA